MTEHVSQCSRNLDLDLATETKLVVSRISSLLVSAFIGLIYSETMKKIMSRKLIIPDKSK